MTEILDNLRQGLAGARALENVGGVGAAVQSRTQREVLDLSGAERETNLDTPDLTNGGDTFTPNAVGGSEDDLLLTLDLVTVELPAGGVLNHIAFVSLGDLFEQGRDVGLRRRLLGGSLLLLFLGTAGQKTRGDHETQQEFVGVVGSVDKVSLAAGDFVGAGTLSRNNDHITDDGSEAIDLSTELDLGDLASLQGGFGFLLVGHQGGVRSHMGARRDSSRVTETFTLDDQLGNIMGPDTRHETTRSTHPC